MTAPDYKLFPMWVVYENADERGDGTPAWFFSNEVVARQQAAGRGWYGGDAPVREHHGLQTSDGRVYWLQQEEPIALNFTPADAKKMRQRALAKLTRDERMLLGLPEDLEED